MDDPVDEYCMQQLREYESMTFVNITKENIDLGLTDDEKAEEEKHKQFEDLCKTMKDVLGQVVKKLLYPLDLMILHVVSHSRFGWSANMERIMKAQALRNDSMMGQMSAQKILEINVDSDIIQELNTRLTADKNDKTIKDIVWLLYEITLLNSGFTLEQSTPFCNRIHRMIRLGLSIDEKEPEEPQIDEEPQENIIEDDSKMEELD